MSLTRATIKQAVSGVLGATEMIDLRSARELADQVKENCFALSKTCQAPPVILCFVSQVTKQGAMVNGDVLLAFAKEK